MLDTKVNSFLKNIADLDWTYNIDQTDAAEICIEFGRYSPAGEDFSFAAWFNGTWEDLIDSVKIYLDCFDKEYHVKGWLDAKESGTRGVPSLKELVEDADAIEEMLENLASYMETY